jgi:CheY-like chemotaxis protein
VGESHWQFPDARVLVVDDGAETRELIRLLLEESGLTVDEAENGLVGVEKASTDNYDLILMDVQMPVMDGFTATKRLRQQGLRTSIIAFTANAMKGFEQQCLESGYSGYLTKPIDVDKFMELMADLLGGKQVHGDTVSTAMQSVLQKSVSEESQVAKSIPIFSKLPSNNEKFRTLITRFVKRLDEQLEAMERARTQGDFGEVAALAHWLKGAGGTVGFDEFTPPASRLEELAKEGREAEVAQAIAKLRGLAARVVVPGDETSTPAIALSEQTLPADSIPTPPTVSTVEKPVVSRLAANPIFHQVILRFIRKLEGEVAKMEQALHERDFEELALLAHWLKGSGGTVGFDDFTEPAAKLENFAKLGHLEQAGQMLERLKCLAIATEAPILEDGRETEKGLAEDEHAARGT